MGNYVKNCPNCNKELHYSCQYSLTRSKNSVCKSCSKKGKPTWILGKHHSDSTKEKISNHHNKKSAWSKGKSLSEIHKKNLSASKMGHIVSKETRKKLSVSCTGKRGVWQGKHLSDDHKKKLRIAKLKKVEVLGIPTKEDIGSREFFKMINAGGFNLKPKRFWNIGYDADGYDEEKHIWVEFDTPYHKAPYQQKKDLIRQQNIIKYFEEIGNPIKEFIRIKADECGNVLESICVYKTDFERLSKYLNIVSRQI